MAARLELDRERCKGCMLCADACPKELLSKGCDFNLYGYYTVQLDTQKECNGCALCAEVCPDVAIEVWREKK